MRALAVAWVFAVAALAFGGCETDKTSEIACENASCPVGTVISLTASSTNSCSGSGSQNTGSGKCFSEGSCVYECTPSVRCCGDELFTRESYSCSQTCLAAGRGENQTSDGTPEGQPIAIHELFSDDFALDDELTNWRWETGNSNIEFLTADSHGDESSGSVANSAQGEVCIYSRQVFDFSSLEDFAVGASFRAEVLAPSPSTVTNIARVGLVEDERLSLYGCKLDSYASAGVAFPGEEWQAVTGTSDVPQVPVRLVVTWSVYNSGRVAVDNIAAGPVDIVRSALAQ